MSEGKVNNDDENGHSERSPYEMGVDKFKSLNIPFNTQVYDLTSHTSVSVGDRTTPQGFCNVMWYDSGFYVTIDEKTAIEQGTSNAIWQMGFMVSKTLQSEYDRVGIKKMVYINTSASSGFTYWRNFPIQDYDVSHGTLGFIHKDEIDLILEIEQGEKH